jgi:hypothetical protein
MRFEEALLSLTRSSQARLTEPQRSKRGIPEPASEKRVGENENEGFRFHESEVEPYLGDVETKRNGKGVRYPEEHDRDIWSSFRASIARQALSPGETPMGSLCTGKQANWRRLSWWNRVSQSDIDTLATKELHHLPPMEATLPISPEHRMRSQWR